MAKNLQAGLRQSIKASRKAGVTGAGIFSLAPLDLRFALQKTLDPRVTFTRASTGTYVGSDGVLQSAVTNLLLRSEEFDNASWTKTNSTVTANATTAPNGTLTADKLITNNTASSGRASVSVTAAVTGSPATLSCFAKQGETSVFGLFISDGVTGRAADFDLITGTVSGTPTAGMTASIEAVGDGWYRCVATVTSITGTTRSLRVVQTVVANDGIKGLYIWGAQFEETSTVGEYIPTTSVINSAPRFDHNPTTGESLGLLVEEARTNLLVRSEEFDNAGWTKIRSTISTNATLAPNGTTTADKFIEDTTASNTHIMVQGASVASGTIYTATFYLKAGERNSIYLSLSVSFAGGTDALFNASTGVATNLGVTSCSMTLVNNGWYRCVATATANATGTGNFNLYSYNGSTIVYTGDGTSGLFLWGAQLEAGASPTSYIPTVAATVTRAADVASITGTAFSSFYNQTEGTFYWEGVIDSALPSGSFGQFFDFRADGSNRLSLYWNPTTTNNVGLFVMTGGVTQVTTQHSLGTNAQSKLSGAYKVNDFASSLSGSVVQTDTSGTLPTSTVASIGSAGATGVLGQQRIRRLTFWPIRLPNPTLQAITTS